jgi:hypothetical protein
MSDFDIEKAFKDIKLPKKEKSIYKKSEKTLYTGSKYHHIVKIFFVKGNKDKRKKDLSNIVIEKMKLYLKKISGRFTDKEIIDLFEKFFNRDLYIEVITLANNNYSLTITEIYKYANEFLAAKTKEGSALAILLRVEKVGRVKNATNKS